MENMIKFLPFHFVLSTDIIELHKDQPFFCGKILTNACGKKKKKKKKSPNVKIKTASMVKVHHEYLTCFPNDRT